MGQTADALNRRNDGTINTYQNTNQDETTDQIEADIERTRNQMSHTIDEIQERLNPQHLADQAREAVYDATVGRAKGYGSNMLETIKQNPIPAAVAALSLGWLIRKNSETSSDRYYEDNTYYREYSPGRYQPYAADYRTRPLYGEQYDYQSGQSGDMRDRMGDMADSAKQKAGDLADNIQDRAQDLQDQASYYGDQAMQQFDEATEWVEDQYQENPLLLGGVALALGAAVGMALPHSHVEDRYLGQAHDTVMDQAESKAHDIAQDVKQTAKEVGSSVKQTVKEEAREHGLS